MMISMLRFISFALVCTAVSARSRPPPPAFIVTVVKQGTVKLRERFGKFKEVLDPGLHWSIPIVDVFQTVPLKEIVLDTPPQNWSL